VEGGGAESRYGRCSVYAASISTASAAGETAAAAALQAAWYYRRWAAAVVYMDASVVGDVPQMQIWEPLFFWGGRQSLDWERRRKTSVP
jgi:hypothetical protein